MCDKIITSSDAKRRIVLALEKWVIFMKLE